MMNNVKIEHVTNFNFLGITLDECMTWETHINKIACKISCTIGTLKRLKRFVPLSVLTMLYNTLILPYINYGILVWGSNLKRIEKVQKTAIRVITNAKYNAHTEPLFKKLSILKIHDIYKVCCLKFFYKYEHKQLPVYFDKMFDTKEASHGYDTRYKDDSQTCVPRTVSAERAVRYAVPVTLNDIPENISEKIYTHSLDGISRYAKNDYCQNYRSFCCIRNCYICNSI